MLFERPSANTPQTMLDKFSIVELIEFERFCRDNARWEEMKTCFAADSTVTISWFQGSGDQFIEASSKMKNPAPHKLNNTVVWLNGDRAVSLTMCSIQTRNIIGGHQLELISDAKLLYKTQKINGKWMIVSFEGIYDKDALVPTTPADGISIPAAELAKFRPSYCHLSYMLSLQGYPINGNLPGVDRPDLVDKVYRDADSWLEGL